MKLGMDSWEYWKHDKVLVQQVTLQSGKTCTWEICPKVYTCILELYGTDTQGSIGEDSKVLDYWFDFMWRGINDRMGLPLAKWKLAKPKVEGSGD